MDELNELDEEIVNEQLQDGLDVPSYVPIQANNANKIVAEDDQLKNMMQI